VATAKMLIGRGHEVVIVERDKDRIESVSHEIDCGYLHGDGGTPAVLREADPAHADFLFCLSNNDQSNILASLVGRTLGFKRVVTKIQDPELVHVCVELGLEDVIIPSQTIGRYLAEMLEGQDPLEMSSKIRGEARMFSFVAQERDEVQLDALDLPDNTRVVCLYRQDRLLVPKDDTRLLAGDEVVLITERANLDALAERWGVRTPPPAE
jgi:trk system potassium uptake protein TrkA